LLKILDQNELKNEVAIIVGTRPGIIKFSPVIRAVKEKAVPFFVIHTGQHYSYNMDKQFFDDLELPEPRYTNQKVKEEVLHGAQTAEMIKGIENALLDSKPKLVIVGGDANTNLAGALAARKLGLIVAHMEAGLRSHDWSMPEEHNRVMIDHISEILFAPTPAAKQNLLADNVKGEIYVVGNPIVDAVTQNQEIANQKSNVLEDYGLQSGEYFLCTIHREENVDNEKRLRAVVSTIISVCRKYNINVMFPIHPRTRKRLNQFGLLSGLSKEKLIQIIEPLGYIDFLRLMINAQIVLTDSGGIQEEACISKVPCITLRENTERPETVEVGANFVAGTSKDSVIQALDIMLNREKVWDNPFGDGKTSERIIGILQKYLMD
jgi:UDP-N-acetylglucosamine 2-epimerase (non-hydrolysing)